MSLPHTREDIERMVEEGQNTRLLVERSFAKNIGVTPDSNGRPRLVMARYGKTQGRYSSDLSNR